MKEKNSEPSYPIKKQEPLARAVPKQFKKFEPAKPIAPKQFKMTKETKLKPKAKG